MLGVTADLYAGLVGAFDAVGPELQRRPLFITGESFAGRYIPALSHYILQAEAAHAPRQHCRHVRPAPGPARPRPGAPAWPRQQQQALQASRKLRQQQADCWAPRHGPRLGLAGVPPPPNFKLVGAAIGNAFTDPVPQTRALAGVLSSVGAVPEAVASEVSIKAEEVVQLVAASEWHEVRAAPARGARRAGV